jgi:transglutaminase/protease-like cytokinesis protein 3
MLIHRKHVFFVCSLLILFNHSYAQRSDFLSINFNHADSVANRYGGHSLVNPRQLVTNLTHSLPRDVEKLRAIYKWVCNNIEFDYSLYLENKQKRERLTPEEFAQWNQKFNKRLFSELVEHRRTVCTGYAYLLRELCSYAGINCVIVDGYGKTSRKSKYPNHSWNAVQLNNKWYLCDATWGSGVVNMTNLEYEKDYKEIYFLTDPVVFARTHEPLDKAWAFL